MSFLKYDKRLSLKFTIPFFATANTTVRRKYLSQSIVFNKSLESEEDVEFCSRFIKDKKEVQCKPKAIVKHLYDNSLIEFMKKYNYYGKWNRFTKKLLELRIRSQCLAI